MKYCTKCVLPHTHETILFDEEGVCNICRQAEKKHKEIDWESRGIFLRNLVSEYKDKGEYDCIIPFSGGKDSTFQLWFVVKELGLKPLVVRYNHWGFRPIVYKNSEKVFKKLGVDVVEFQSNWHIVKALMKESLLSTGDFCWHCHLGVFVNTLRLSIKFNTPLIIFGESGAEYRAYTSFDDVQKVNATFFNTVVNLNLDVDAMYAKLHGAVSKRDLLPFTVPSQEELENAGTNAIWLGDYIKWDTKHNVEIIKKELGWEGASVEGIPPQYDYEKIECKWQGIRDYCKYVKRGHGRTNHLCCIDIRQGRMKREEALKLCEQYDGKRPASLDVFLPILEISEDEFLSALHKSQIDNWGFDKNIIQTGEALPDMDDWGNDI